MVGVPTSTVCPPSDVGPCDRVAFCIGASSRGSICSSRWPDSEAGSSVCHVPALAALITARLVTRAGTERSFWGESWASHTVLLTELVGVLRASRPAQIVDVDEGWRPDRDLSLAIGRWGWLHVGTLVEEHEHGACLFRVRARLRPSFAGTLRGVTLAVLVAGGMSASMFIYDPSVTLVVAVVAIAAIGGSSWIHA